MFVKSARAICHFQTEDFVSDDYFGLSYCWENSFIICIIHEENEDYLSKNVLVCRCKCGKCVLMPTVEESVCCCDFEKISMKTSSQSNINCRTEHGGFKPVCLNQHVLDTAYYC